MDGGGHSIVFSGKLRPGHSAEQVRGNFATLFKLSDPVLLERMFSGAPVVLRRNLSPEDAKRYAVALFQAGALCDVRGGAPVTAVASPPPAAPPAEASPPAVVSPPPAESSQPAESMADRVMGHVRRRDSAEPPLPPPPAPAGLALMEEPVAPAQPRAPARADRASPRDQRFDGEHERPPPPTPPRADPDREKRAAAIEGIGAAEGDAWEVGSPLPMRAAGLCWGGFFAPLLWGTFNGMTLSFLPIIGIKFLRGFLPAWAWIVFCLAFGGYYLVAGRELAWRRKRWRDTDHFLKVQRWWTLGGAVFFVLFITGMVSLWRSDVQAEKEIVAYTALFESELIEDPAQRAQARITARRNVLAVTSDAQERAELQKEWDEQDREEAEYEALLRDEDAGAGEDSWDSGDPDEPLPDE